LYCAHFATILLVNKDYYYYCERENPAESERQKYSFLYVTFMSYTLSEASC